MRMRISRVASATVLALLARLPGRRGRPKTTPNSNGPPSGGALPGISASQPAQPVFCHGKLGGTNRAATWH